VDLRNAVDETTAFHISEEVKREGHSAGFLFFFADGDKFKNEDEVFVSGKD